MILPMKRLPIVLAGALLLVSTGLDAAVVSGKVAFVTKRGQKPVPTETLVWLDAVGTRTPPPKKPATTAQMTTRGKTVLPHVIAVPAGSTIQFPNEDPISHNLFSLTTGNTFDLGLYRKGPGKPKKFDAPGAVNVYCNVHPNMSAVIHVMTTPYYGFADANGSYSFDVPPGKYRLTAWNEQGGTTTADIELGADGKVVGNTQLTIDSRNFRFIQHKNKVGQTYKAPKEY
jgi:plastocyanin